MENQNIVWLRLLFSNVKIAKLEDKKMQEIKFWAISQYSMTIGHIWFMNKSHIDVWKILCILSDMSI